MFLTLAVRGRSRCRLSPRLEFGEPIEDDLDRGRGDGTTGEIHDSLARRDYEETLAVSPVYGEPDAKGRRTRRHVERQINEAEAAIVRRIFQLCAEGHGMRQVAHQLNAVGAVCPRSQQRRPSGWAPSSIRAVLYRAALSWGDHLEQDPEAGHLGAAHQQSRAEAEWLRVPAPDLRIVSDAEWHAAHARLGEARALYLRGTKGQLWGHPARGTESKYLLGGLATCGVCGSGLSVRSRQHGKRRAFFYVCTAYHTRGRHVCANKQELPMTDANAAVLSAMGEQVLSPAVVEAAVTRALERLAEPQPVTEAPALRDDLRRLDGELTRLTSALATGADLTSVVTAIRDRERQKATLEQKLAAVEQVGKLPDLNRDELEQILRDRLDVWRGLLGRHIGQARQILRKLLVGRLVVTPEGDHAEVTGTGSLGPFLSGVLLPKGMASLSVPSWNQVLCWLKEMDTLRKATQLTA